MQQLLEQARHEATGEISAAIIDAINKGLKRHGDDPESFIIVAAAFLHALREFEPRSPGLAVVLVRSLAHS